jgi:hypothetical protein
MGNNPSQGWNPGYQQGGPNKGQEDNAINNDILKLKQQIQNWSHTEVNDKVMNQILPNVILSLNPPKVPGDEPQDPSEMMDHMVREHVKRNMTKEHNHSRRWRTKVYKSHMYLRIRMNHTVFWVKHRESYHLVKHR